MLVWVSGDLQVDGVAIGGLGRCRPSGSAYRRQAASQAEARERAELQEVAA